MKSIDFRVTQLYTCYVLIRENDILGASAPHGQSKAVS